MSQKYSFNQDWSKTDFPTRKLFWYMLKKFPLQIAWKIQAQFPKMTYLRTEHKPTKWD